MPRRFLAALCFVCLPLAADVTSQYETVRVAEGIWAFIAPEPKSGVVNGNTTVIAGDDGVVVVDTGQFPTLAGRQIAEIRKLTGKPVRAIINTHWHWDHNLANATYRAAFPAAPIISTPFTRDFMATFTPAFLQRMTADGVLERIRTSPGIDPHLVADFERGIPELKKAVTLAPDVTFEREVTIHLGSREVHVRFPGRANTAGDAIVWVPDARVLVTGDLVVWPTPYATSAYPREWLTAMDALLALDAAAIVPGHGPVQRDEKYMEQIARALRSVVDQTAAAVRDGLTLEGARKRVDLEPVRKEFAGDDPLRRKAFDDYFAASVVTNAYKQARGEPTDESPFPRPPAAQ